MPHRSGDARQDLVEEYAGQSLDVEIHPAAPDAGLRHLSAGMPVRQCCFHDQRPRGVYRVKVALFQRRIALAQEALLLA